MLDWVHLVGGASLLYLGAEWFVGGASALALALRVPQLIVGLTVVAYGTSAPELVVGVQAASTGHGDVALGNVVGSNIANIGLILAVTALVRPPKADASLAERELPVLVLTTLLVPAMLLDGVVARLDGAVLLVGALGFTLSMVRSARAGAAATRREAAAVADDAARTTATPKPSSPLRAALLCALGLGVLLVGGNRFVAGAVSVASSLGMSERLVGLTVVAVGTSLPELVTSVIAARRGHSAIAIGNVVGSNIFNVLLCLGAAAVARPLVAPVRVVGFELGVLAGMTALVVLFLRRERVVSRSEGGLALGFYVLFLAAMIAYR